MNVKRFTARSSREALMAVRQAFGNDAIVVSTRPCPEGVEVLAMAPDGVQQFERIACPPVAAPKPPARAAAAASAAAPASSVDADVAALGMSTLSFQDYVRERMLKRRQAELTDERAPASGATAVSAPMPTRPATSAGVPAPRPSSLAQTEARPPPPARRPAESMAEWADQTAPLQAPVAAVCAPPLPRATDPIEWRPTPSDAAAPARREQTAMLDELRSMRGLIEQRFGALAFMEKLQRQPRQA
ncbi:MAG: flagellar biosynthesis protein FlhF, partial [Rubrivivax sp.]